jgi:predicted nuclease of predicted toxin-antitoxin system
MKFVVDQQLPPALARWIERKGHEAAHVRELGMREADDSDIWRFAVANALTIVTKDSDFGLRRLQATDGPPILWLRIGNTTIGEIFRILEGAWPSVEEDLKSGLVVEVR